MSSEIGLILKIVAIFFRYGFGGYPVEAGSGAAGEDRAKMLPQQFRISRLEQFTSSSSYTILPHAQLQIDQTLPEMSSDNMPSADCLGVSGERLAELRCKATEIIAADDGSPYELTDEGLLEMREVAHALWRH